MPRLLLYEEKVGVGDESEDYVWVSLVKQSKAKQANRCAAKLRWCAVHNESTYGVWSKQSNPLLVRPSLLLQDAINDGSFWATKILWQQQPCGLRGFAPTILDNKYCITRRSSLATSQKRKDVQRCQRLHPPVTCSSCSQLNLLDFHCSMLSASERSVALSSGYISSYIGTSTFNLSGATVAVGT